MYYKLKIIQITRVAPGKNPWGSWERLKGKFETLQEVKEKLEDLYGKVPFIEGNEIYRDTDRGKPVHIGYRYSFWEYCNDRSKPPDAKYWATDWIEIQQIHSRPVTSFEDYQPVTPRDVVKSLDGIEDHHRGGDKTIAEDGAIYFDIYPKYQWSAPTRREYETIEAKISNFEATGDGWRLYAWCDVSGFEYWMLKQREPNYIQFTLEFTKAEFHPDEIKEIDRAVDRAYENFKQFEDWNNFPDED